MTQYITIGFDKPQAMIARLLTRAGLDNHAIQINNEQYDLLIHVTDTYLKVDDVILEYPVLINDVIRSIKKYKIQKDNDKNG
jgi:hypothetical protein